MADASPYSDEDSRSLPKEDAGSENEHNEDKGLFGRKKNSNGKKDEKHDKDLKGLVFQGGEQKEQPEGFDDISNPPTGHSEDNKGLDKPVGGIGASTKGEDNEPDITTESYMDISEKGGISKTIIVAVVAIAIIAIVAYILLSSHGKAVTTTTTTTIKGSGTTTILHTGAPNTTAINNLDVSYNYSGPSEVNGVNCGERSYSNVVNYNNNLNASENFTLYVNLASAGCNFSITGISTSTPGFKVLKAVPALPVSIPSESNVYILLTLRAPSTNFLGPLTLVVKEK